MFVLQPHPQPSKFVTADPFVTCQPLDILHGVRFVFLLIKLLNCLRWNFLIVLLYTIITDVSLRLFLPQLVSNQPAHLLLL